MRVFQLQIDLEQGMVVGECGLSLGCRALGDRQLLVQQGFVSARRTIFLFGKTFSLANEGELRAWVERFRPDRMASWAVEVDADLLAIVLEHAEREVYLISDRTGGTRCYYAKQGGRLLVTNSRKQLIGLLDRPRLSSLAAYELLTVGYDVHPECLIEGARKTGVGEIVTSRLDTMSVTTYHRPVEMEADYFGTEQECTQALDETLRQVMRKRLSDRRTPCVLLSGGIDSLVVLKYLSDLSPGGVHSLNFSLAGQVRNEQAEARGAAGFFGSKHYELVIDPARAAELYLKSMLEADTWNYASILQVASREYLESIGPDFDLFHGDDTRLHTPMFDLAKELAIRLQGYSGLPWPTRPVLSMLSRALRGAPLHGSLKNYMAHWGRQLEPRASLRSYVTQTLFGFNPQTTKDGRPGELARRLLAELPEFGPKDGLQEVSKKYIAFLFRTMWTDNMHCHAANWAGPKTEIHGPFYDWQFLSISNHIPYHIGARRIFTTKSQSKLPIVQKKPIRLLLQGQVPDELIYRQKATAPSAHLLFNHGLRQVVDRMLERWLSDLVESVAQEVRELILPTLERYRGVARFELNRDEELLTAMLTIAFLCFLNHLCLHPGADYESELREMCGCA